MQQVYFLSSLLWIKKKSFHKTQDFFVYGTSNNYQETQQTAVSTKEKLEDHWVLKINSLFHCLWKWRK